MDGVSKGPRNQSPEAAGQVDRLTVQGQHNDKTVDTTEQGTAIPEPILQHEEAGLWERQVSIAADSDVDWSDDEYDGHTSGFDSDTSSSDDDFSLPGYGGSLNAIDRREDGNEAEIVFEGHEDVDSSSGFDSESLTGSCDNLPLQELATKQLPEAISLGKMPDPSNATNSEILIDDDKPAIGQALKVVRYLPEGQNRKGLIIRSRSIDSSDDDAKAAYDADCLEAEILNSLAALESDSVINFHGFKGTIDPQTYTTHLCTRDGGLTMTRAITRVESDKLVPTIISWLFDLAQGLAVLKQNHILHRDIKPSNLLVDMDENRLRIADFGNAHQVIDYRFPSDASGSELYSAPEVKERKPQYYSADIYSAGISLVEIMMNANLLTVHTWQEFSRHYQQRLPVTLAEPHCQQPSTHVLAELINGMIEKDPDQRPEAETIIGKLQEHRWQS